MNNMRAILKWDERGHDRTALGREVRAPALKPEFDSSMSCFLPGPTRYIMHTGSTVFVLVWRMVLHAIPMADAGGKAVV